MSLSTPWFGDGLRFECTRCGACCTGAAGFVWVDVAEIERLAARLKMSLDTFGRKYLRQVEDRISLVEKPNNDCVFWERGKGCTVYEDRPIQCRTWPFWGENIATREDWVRVEGVCPGSGEGRLYTLGEILEAADRTPML